MQTINIFNLEQHNTLVLILEDDKPNITSNGNPIFGVFFTKIIIYLDFDLIIIKIINHWLL